jgi:hypothetical protein
MYYDTVAGFAYWEGDPQKLETLFFFNFLRQSFEDHFLLLLPSATARHPRRWTRGIGALGLAGGALRRRRPADQDFEMTGDEPLAEIALIASAWARRSAGCRTRSTRGQAQGRTGRADAGFDDFERAISTLTAVDQRRFVRFLPSVTVLRQPRRRAPRLFAGGQPRLRLPIHAAVPRRRRPCRTRTP